MGDRNGGSGRGEPVKCFLDYLFRFRIESRCGLVKNQYRRVLEDGSCNADALSLASRELSSAVSDVCLIALFLLHYEVMGIGNLRGSHDLLHGRAFHTEGYVVEYGVVEQDGFLVDVAYQAAQILHSEIPDVCAVKCD